MTWEIAITVLTLLGVSKIVEIIVKQAFRKRSKRTADIEQTKAADIDLDKFAFKSYSERVTLLEGKVDSLTAEVQELKVVNAELKKDNEVRIDENSRLRNRVEKQSDDIKELKDKLYAAELLNNSLKTDLADQERRYEALESEHKHLQRELSELQRTVKELVGDPGGAQRLIQESRKRSIKGA